MKKVIIIGCPGAGKSTFSRLLHSKTGLPLFHLDMLYWNTDKTHVTREVFDERLNEILKRDRFIIDGNYGRTMEIRFKNCDTIFLLDMPTQVCLDGAKSRVGKARADMPWIEKEFDLEFKNWITEFSEKELQQIYFLLEKYNDKNIIIFNSHDQIKEYLEMGG